MKQILTVKTKVSNTRYIGEDALGRTFSITTSNNLLLDSTVLINNGNYVGRVNKAKTRTYEV